MERGKLLRNFNNILCKRMHLKTNEHDLLGYIFVITGEINCIFNSMKQ